MATRKKTVKFRAHGGVELHFGRSTGGDFMPHFHTECQIQLVTRGAFELRTVDRRFVIEQGMICALDPHQVHASVHIGNGWSSRAIYLPPSLFASLSGRRSPSFVSPAIDDPALAATLLRAHEFGLAEGGVGFDDVLAQVQVLLDRYTIECLSPILSPSIARAIDFLNTHYVTGASLPTTAAVAGYSPYYFLRLFARQTGVTPNDFQTSLRVAHAKRALRSSATGAQAALEAGFFDQSHLIRALRRTHGLTPGTLRRAFMQSKLVTGW